MNTPAMAALIKLAKVAAIIACMPSLAISRRRLGAIEPIAPICKRCVKQSAGALTKSKHWDWSKPIES